MIDSPAPIKAVDKFSLTVVHCKPQPCSLHGFRICIWKVHKCQRYTRITKGYPNCWIFQPAFGCCALQTLVKKVIFSIYSGPNIQHLTSISPPPKSPWEIKIAGVGFITLCLPVGINIIHLFLIINNKPNKSKLTLCSLSAKSKG